MKEEKKHNHNLTKKLKAILFAVIMVLPILSVIGTILVCTFNENAESTQQSQLNITYKYETETPEYNTTTKTYTLKENKIYNFNEITILFSENPDIDIYIKPITTDSLITLTESPSYIYFDGLVLSEINSIEITPTMLYIEQDNRNAGIECDYDAEVVDILINGIWQIISNNYNIKIPEQHGEITATTYNEIDTATITTTGIDITNPYKLGKQHAEEMLQFTTGTIAYNGINTMLVGLGITDTFYSKIIAYWLILTAVYIVIDIIIELFTFLTHIINSKQ